MASTYVPALNNDSESNKDTLSLGLPALRAMIKKYIAKSRD